VIGVAGLWARFAPWTIFSALRTYQVPFSDDEMLGSRIQQEWAAGVLAILGTRFDAAGSRQAPDQGPYIVMANHESLLDPPLLVRHLGIDRLRFVAKAGLFFIPIFGRGMKILGHIPVDRGNHAKAVASLQRAADRIRAGTSVLIFPEGTRNDGRGVMRSFKKGGFHLALQSGVPILPVAVFGTAEILSKGDWAPTQEGTVRILVGAPIATAGLTAADLGDLIARTRAAIEALLQAGRQGQVEAAADA
jgi:1-acyl-sn-glycerol-3-phosphate acyltransferase